MASMSLASLSPGSGSPPPPPPPPGAPLRPEELLLEDDGLDDGSLSESELPPWLELESPSRFKPSSPTFCPGGDTVLAPKLSLGGLAIAFETGFRESERDKLMVGTWNIFVGVGGVPGGTVASPGLDLTPFGIRNDVLVCPGGTEASPGSDKSSAAGKLHREQIYWFHGGWKTK